MSVDPVFDIVLVMLLVAHALSDISTRLIRTPGRDRNGPAAGLPFCPLRSGRTGVQSQGLALGMVLLVIPFFMGGIGAGDVKLLGW